MLAAAVLLALLPLGAVALAGGEAPTPRAGPDAALDPAAASPAAWTSAGQDATPEAGLAGTPAGGALARALGDGFTFPMRFEPDHGRTSPGLLYRAVSTGPLMEVRDDGLHLLGPEGERIHLRVPGADWRTAAGAAPTGAYTNDLRAGVPAATLPHYAQLRFPGILPGIELVLYEAPQGGIEFDVVVSPGADPAAFRLQAAHGRWTLDGRDAVLEGAPMPLRLPAPYTFQVQKDRQVDSAFTTDGRSLGFSVGAYDKSLPLTIDPILAYSTYVPSGGWNDWVSSVTADPDSPMMVYAAGSMSYPNLTPTPGKYSQYTTWTWYTDAFVVKLDVSKAGSASLQWFTLIGGGDSDDVVDIEVDARNIYVAGSTYSGSYGTTAFPTTSNGYQTVRANPNGYHNDAYLFVLNRAGPAPEASTLVYSTLLGAGVVDRASALATFGDGSVVMVGVTAFPPANIGPPLAGKAAWDVTHADATGGYTDAFVARFGPFSPAPSGPQSLQWLGLLGGSGGESANDVKVRPNGDVVVGGSHMYYCPTASTSCTPFPTTPGAYLPALAPSRAVDGWVAVIPGDGGASKGLLYSTMLYGPSTSVDVVTSVALSGDRIYAAGMTLDHLFPTVPGSFLTTDSPSDGDDVFVVLLDPTKPTGGQLVAGTYWDGAATSYTYAQAVGLEVDVYGRVVVAALFYDYDWTNWVSCTNPAASVPEVNAPPGLSKTGHCYAGMAVGRFSPGLDSLDLSFQFGAPWGSGQYPYIYYFQYNWYGFQPWEGLRQQLALNSRAEILVGFSAYQDATLVNPWQTHYSGIDGYIAYFQKAAPDGRCQAPGGHERGKPLQITGIAKATDAPIDPTKAAWWFDHDGGPLGPPDLQWGDPGFSLTPSHTYPVTTPPGDKLVVLRVSDVTDQVPHTVYAECKVKVVNAKPVAAISADKPFAWRDGVTRVTAMRWEGGVPVLSRDPDGTHPTDQLSFYWTLPVGEACDVGPQPWEASCTWGTDGTHTFGLAVVDGDGGASFALQAIEVGEPRPWAAFTAAMPGSPTFTYCGAAPPVHFTDHSVKAVADIVAWHWDFDGDGVPESYARNPTHTFDGAGARTVTLTVIDADGYRGTTTTTFRLTEVEGPQARIGTTIFAPVLTGAAVTFFDHSDPGASGITSRAWLVDGEEQGSSGASWTTVFGRPGLHQVGLRVEDAKGCVSEDIRRVQVEAIVPDDGRPPIHPPGPQAAVAGPAQAAVGELVRFRDATTLDGAPLWDHHWDLGDGSAAQVEEEASGRYAAPGTYVVTHTVRDALGRTSTAHHTIEVVLPTPAGLPEAAAPVADAGADRFALAGSTVRLRAEAAAPGSRALQHGWEQLSGPTVTLKGADTAAPEFVAPAVQEETPLVFRVTVADGMQRSAPDLVVVRVVPPGPLSIVAQPLPGGAVRFAAPDATPGVPLTWDLGDGTTSAEASPVHTYARAGAYTVRVQAGDGPAATHGAQEVQVRLHTVDGPVGSEQAGPSTWTSDVAGVPVAAAAAAFLAVAALLGAGLYLAVRRL